MDYVLLSRHEVVDIHENINYDCHFSIFLLIDELRADYNPSINFPKDDAVNFRQKIAFYLRQLIDSDMTQREVAIALGFPESRGNVISMHLNPEHSISPFPWKRVVALAQVCELTSTETFELFLLRAKHHPSSSSEIDLDTFKFMAKSTVQARNEHASKRVKETQHA